MIDYDLIEPCCFSYAKKTETEARGGGHLGFCCFVFGIIFGFYKLTVILHHLDYTRISSNFQKDLSGVFSGFIVFKSK